MSTVADLPDPLTPPDCDLRGFGWMALLGDRLFKSTFYRRARKDPRAGLAGLKLWWEAMQQTPAGSLPNDEEDLCMLADFGEDMRAWRKHRDVAMHGWKLCSDGRLYHPVVAEQANTAWENKLKANETRVGWRERQRRWRAGHNGPNPPHPSNDVTRDEEGDIVVTNKVTDNVTRLDVTGDVTRARLTVPRQDRTGQESTNPSPTPAHVVGQGLRSAGTNPRALGTNPRALRTNQGAMGANPRGIDPRQRTQRIRNPVIAEMLEDQHASPIMENWTDYAWTETEPGGR